ncbi:MAG: 3-hydroxyacyl-CoA dehydrogenase NAD-binding domain-containing protein [Archaeoglobales archaeon]|nr:3-hydroxyacyl-CoA dehydrogenase NAD-binding domain-containing protein [Archaeoglobales archaeon]
MATNKIKKVAVLGAGTMGHGIVELCAIAGYNVAMRDIKQEFVDRGMKMIRDSVEKLHTKGKLKDSVETIMGRITPTVDMATAIEDADLIVEAIPEIFNLKLENFKECEKYAKQECIFTSNTSTMSITGLAKATKREDKFAGLHFFNPPVLMQLVEVIRGEKTSEETMKTLVEFVKSIGKVPVRVEKDVPGFIANRVTAPRSVLLFAMLEKGVATPEEIDATLRRAGYPMGAFELLDYVGLDVHYNGQKYYSQTISPDFTPSKIIEEKVKKGELGAKTGKGFYDWSKGRPQIDLSKAGKIDPLDLVLVEINEAVKLYDMGVATPQDIDTALKLGYNRAKGPFEILKELDVKKVAQRLEELSKTYNKKIFMPADSLRTGNIAKVLK